MEGTEAADFLLKAELRLVLGLVPSGSTDILRLRVPRSNGSKPSTPRFTASSYAARTESSIAC